MTGAVACNGETRREVGRCTRAGAQGTWPTRWWLPAGGSDDSEEGSRARHGFLASTPSEVVTGGGHVCLPTVAPLLASELVQSGEQRTRCRRSIPHARGCEASSSGSCSGCVTDAPMQTAACTPAVARSSFSVLTAQGRRRSSPCQPWHSVPACRLAVFDSSSNHGLARHPWPSQGRSFRTHRGGAIPHSASTATNATNTECASTA